MVANAGRGINEAASDIAASSEGTNTKRIPPAKAAKSLHSGKMSVVV
jgi:hypothetical protein